MTLPTAPARGPDSIALEAPAALTPSPSQRVAIESPPGAQLVLAGPGAGKTFCLIERIAFLVDSAGIAPARICAFTFTNKAAGEIATRLEERLGSRAENIRRGTIHAFCAELLREFGSQVGLQQGFGIVDEDYQCNVLHRLEGYRKWHRNLLNRFSAYRFRGDPLQHNDLELLARYEAYLAQRNLADFDTLVIKAAELLENAACSAAIRARWDVILVDEFQDLNPVQYRVVKALAADHRHVFAVGDDEQSIYSWAGADPGVFRFFVNEFGIASEFHLGENRRCPAQVVELAKKLVTINTPIFAHRQRAAGHAESPFPVAALSFLTEEDEARWIVADIASDRARHGFPWGEAAVLYRRHETGDYIESAFLNAGLPCRLAPGRAFAEEPVIAYVVAALRVIANPDDSLQSDLFLKSLLPRGLFDNARAQAEAARRSIRRQLDHMASQLPSSSESARQIRRALFTFRNLKAIGERHTSLSGIVQELLSQRVGQQKSILEELHDELSDPAATASVVQLSDRLLQAKERGTPVRLPALGGAEIPMRAMLKAAGFAEVLYHADPRSRGDELEIGVNELPEHGFALGVYKALQLAESREFGSAFGDFTAIDIETTDNKVETCEVVEIAAVRVRDGRIVEELARLVKPRGKIAEGARRAHGITDDDVRNEAFMEEVWPAFQEFCGSDVVVAHNGYTFDFRILKRIAKESGLKFDITTFDTLPLARDLFPTSRKLGDLAVKFKIETGTLHRALDDSRLLAHVFLHLEKEKLERARKTGLVNLLGHLGVALALSTDDSASAEQKLFRDRICTVFSLGRYSGAIEHYEAESRERADVPGVDEVIERLGGAAKMERLRADKSASDRYPTAMARLRRIIEEISEGDLRSQIREFLDRAMLSSKSDGYEPDPDRVNLLTLHSTKGLEFSRVYIVGVEDAQMPGGTEVHPASMHEIEEARRLLYVGMTRASQRLVLTRAETRAGRPTGGHRFLDEMGVPPGKAP